MPDSLTYPNSSNSNKQLSQHLPTNNNGANSQGAFGNNNKPFRSYDEGVLQ